jgi:hypothetical protein
MTQRPTPTIVASRHSTLNPQPVPLDDISANSGWRPGRPCSSDRRFRSPAPVVRSRHGRLNRRARAWQKQGRGAVRARPPSLRYGVTSESSLETIRTTESHVHLTPRGGRRPSLSPNRNGEDKAWSDPVPGFWQWIHARIRCVAPAEQTAEWEAHSRAGHRRYPHRKGYLPNGKHDDDWHGRAWRWRGFRIGLPE